MAHEDLDTRLVGEALRMLDLALVEWLTDGTCRPISPTPKWFKGTTAWGSLPFLEYFVKEALTYLHDHLGGVLASDQFTVDGHDEELLLRAHALKIDGRLVLAIERLRGASDVRPILREAREQALEHEALVERARALHGPIAEVVRAADAVRDASGSPLAPSIVAALLEGVTDLTGAAAALPQPRKRRR
jgi:hypothetical protein